MNSNNKITLVPKLRFHGFKESWSIEPISKVLAEHKLKNVNGRDVFSVSMESGIVNQIEHLGRSYAAADTSHYTVARRFDVVYTKSPLKAFPFGIVKQSKFDGEIALSPLYGVFTPVNPHVGLMIEAYFESPNRSISFLAPLCQKGAKNTLQITNDTFLSGRLPLPQEPAEQEKIANCLSSLDELIAAQGRKVDALKTHKKGLMRQLFPREGETHPSFRFPEFQNTGKWEVKALSEIVQVASGQVDPTQPPYFNFPQIGSENIESDTGKLVNVKSAGEKGVISGNYTFDDKDVLYSKIRPALNKSAAPEFNGICSADIYPIRPANNAISRIYLLYLLLSDKFLEHAIRSSDRGKIPKINRDDLLTFKSAIPKPPEQHRIVECLSSLDRLLTAATQELDALKTHKKGLMQQLFPSPEEAEQ